MMRQKTFASGLALQNMVKNTLLCLPNACVNGAPGRAAVVLTFGPCAVAPGSVIRGFCVPRAASGTRRRIATTITASGLSRI